MAKLCLKCRYERQSIDKAPDFECPQCGAIYEKVEAALEAKREAPLVANAETRIVTAEGRLGKTLVTLGMPLAFIGLTAFVVFAYHDYQIRLQLNEAYSLSNAARTALGIACSDGDLASKTDNALLGLASPTDYRTKVVKSIEAAGLNSTSGKMTITFRAIGVAIPEGAQTLFHGECSSRGMTWTVTSGAGMPSKFVFRS